MTESNLRRIGSGLAVVGVAIASYIAIAAASGDAPACVAGGHGCQTVADSSYAHLAGISVSAIGIGGYLLLLGAFAARGDAARFIGLLAALVGFGFSLYLTYLELFVIDAICQWCIASALLMTALLVCSVWRVVGFSGTELRLEGPAQSRGDHGH